MFNRIAQRSLFVLLALTALAQAQNASVRQEQSSKISIIIDRQLVRFVAPGETLGWQLVIVNQQGEVIFDSGLANGSVLEWPLSNQQGEAVASGLYTYTLSINEPTSVTPRLQRGHIIVDRPSTAERIWVTSEQRASLGATSTDVKLTVVGGELTVGGAEFPGGVPSRAATAERPELPQRAADEASSARMTTPATVNGTANRIAKFDSNGNLIDSAMIEVGGSVGIGTLNPNRLFQLSMFGQPTFAFSDTRGASGKQEMGFLYDAGCPTCALTHPGLVWQDLNDSGGFVANRWTFWKDGSITFGGSAITHPASAGQVAFLGGNVGIGTTAPDRLFHLSLFGQPTFAFSDTRGASGKQQMGFLYDSACGSCALSKPGLVWQDLGDAGNFVANLWSFFKDGSINFGGIGAPAAAGQVVFTGGNVGIGTTNPDAKLSITATGNGARVLHLGTERAWVFKQLGTGAATALELTGADPNNNNKHFVINTDGNVGIGTDTNLPQAKLQVIGDVKLGSSGQLFAPGGEENLRIVRGNVYITGTILNGSGFQVTHAGEGRYTITFDTPFTDRPTVTASIYFTGASVTHIIVVSSILNSAFEIETFRRSDGSYHDVHFTFIAVGPR